MIAFDQVGKRFLVDGEPGPWTLKDVSFRIDSPRAVAVMGGSWEERTALLQLVSGQELPTCGTVAVPGRVAYPLKYISQLQVHLTGKQNARFIARVLDGDGDLEQRLAAIGEWAQLGAKYHEPVKTYSVQMRARLSFALSICLRFEAYVCESNRLAGALGFGAEEATSRWIEETARRAVVLVAIQRPSKAEFVLSKCQSALIVEGGSTVWFDDLADAPRPSGRRPRKTVDLEDSDTIEDTESDDDL
jgi:capsular polysaccharide transport system ATP-binding protein